jgi:hypothetical protein
MTDNLTAEEQLEKRVRDSAPLMKRLEEITKRIAHMCANHHGPKMSIPVEWYDDDFFIATTIKDAIAALTPPSQPPADVLRDLLEREPTEGHTYKWQQERRAALRAAARQAEIVTIEVRDDKIVNAVMKAPGLPDGLHNLFCAPAEQAQPIDASSIARRIAARDVNACRLCGHDHNMPPCPSPTKNGAQ